MSDFDPVAYLASKGYIGRQGHGAEVTFPCFFDCGEPPDSRKRKLYLNAEDCVYTCFVCGASGGSYLLQKHFGDEPVKEAPGTDPFTRRKILDWATDIGAAMLTHQDGHLLYLMDERGLSVETILERKLGFIGNSWSLVGSLPEEFSKDELKSTGLVLRDGPRVGQDFFYHHLLIPYLSRGHTVQMRGKAFGSGGKYMTGPGEQVLLFNVDSLEGADEVIITEGEFDAMVLQQHLQSSPEDRIRKIAVIGLAGANGFTEGAERYLSQCKRVYIGLDPDDTGRRAAVAIKERLGTRARIIELPAHLPKCDWTEYLLPIPVNPDSEWKAKHPHAGHGWADVLLLLGQAAGKRVFSMMETAASWRRDENDGTPRLFTGFVELDASILGMKRGQVCIFLAKTGTGKTVLLCNLGYNMRRYRILFLSLEMTKEEIYERLRRIYLFHHPTADDHTIEYALANIWICDENRLGERDISVLIDEYEVETGFRPDAVFVDYLGYYARGAHGRDQYEKNTNAVMNLKGEAKKAKVVIVCPSQVNRGAKQGKPIDLDDARDSGAIEETADFLLSIWRPEDALVANPQTVNMQRSGKLKIDVLKSRHGGQGDTIGLSMDYLTLVVVDDKSPAAKQVQENNFNNWRGQTYEELRAEQLREARRGTQTTLTTG